MASGKLVTIYVDACAVLLYTLTGQLGESIDGCQQPFLGCAAAVCILAAHVACVCPRPAAGQWFECSTGRPRRGIAGMATMERSMGDAHAALVPACGCCTPPKLVLR
eukprot:365608-Chlamydomonas_euryale.AAC.24